MVTPATTANHKMEKMSDSIYPHGPSQFSGIVNLICTECGKNYVTHCNECARKDSVPVVELEPIIKLLKNMQAFMTMEVWESTLKEIARLEALKGGAK